MIPYSFRTGIYLLPFVILLGNNTPVNAQIELGERMIISGKVIYKDHQKPWIYYYLPAGPRLTEGPNGGPDLKFIQMRYTGSTTTGDKDQKRFLNYLKFALAMPGIPHKTYKTIKKELGPNGNIELKPLPIQYMDYTLVIPFDNDGKQEYAEVEETKANMVPEKINWTSKTFTVKLNNREAQLLNDQIKNDQLTVSFNYGFYADVVHHSAKAIAISGDASVIQNFKDRFTHIEKEREESTPAKAKLIYANAFSLEPSIFEESELVKKIDINADAPPGYPIIEIRCYDFSEERRPDLYLKCIEFRMTSAEGKEINWREEFYRKDKAQIVRKIQIPYAVRLDQILEYQITEVDVNGTEHFLPWKKMVLWSEVIDMSTPWDQLKVVERQIEAEIDPGIFQEKDVKAVNLLLTYSLNELPIQQELVFKENSPIIQELNIRCDKESMADYSLTWHYRQTEKVEEVKRKLDGDYIFISLPNPTNHE